LLKANSYRRGQLLLSGLSLVSGLLRNKRIAPGKLSITPLSKPVILNKAAAIG
jgi:hypothetical protein